MLGLRLDLSDARPLRLLCLGAHCDDIEIGCGGTILKLAGSERPLEVRWTVFGSDPCRKREALKSAGNFLQAVPSHKVVIHSFRDGFFPNLQADIKGHFEDLKREYSPDLILTHYRKDLHQDHRVISELTWNTFRDHLILEYEIPKYDGDMGIPNFYVHLDDSLSRQKTKIIIDCFQSQKQKQWFGEDTFLALLRLRGIESNAPAKYAEAFYCRKIIL